MTSHIRLRIIGVFIFSLALLQEAAAQPLQLPSRQWSLEEGLSDRLVTDLLLHSNGLVWVATPSGLNRFDGYNFIEFADYPDEGPSLSDINIDRIFEDHRGRILVEYRFSPYFFDLLDPYSEEVERVDLLPGSGIKGLAQEIAVDKAGFIHVVSISDEGTHIFRVGETLEELLVIPEKHYTLTEVELCPLSDGSFLLFDEEKGLRWVDSTGTLLGGFGAAQFEELAAEPSDVDILYEDRAGRVWLSFSGQSGLYRFQRETVSWERFELPTGDLPVRKVWEDEVGNLFFALGSGAGRPPEYQRLISLNTKGEIEDQSYLLRISDGLFVIRAQDFFKEVFVGSGNGLHVVQNNRADITALLNQPQLVNEDAGVISSVIGGPGNSAVIGTKIGKWYQYWPRTEQLDTLTFRSDLSGRAFSLGCGANMFRSRSGLIWGLTCPERQPQYLIAYDPLTTITRSYPFPQRIIDFTEDSQGIIWLICELKENLGLLVSFDPKTGQFQEYFSAEGKNPLRESRPYCLETRGDSMIWIGTNRGIQRVDLPSRTSTRYLISPNPASTNSYSVLTIHQESDSLLWLGTNHGLVSFNPEAGILSVFSRKDGLSHDRVVSIIPDEKGNLWMGTYYGLSYFDMEQGLFRSFFQDDGLSSNEFLPSSAWKSPDGRYYFGSTNGLNVFFSEKLLTRESTPPVVLTRVSKYNPRDGGLQVQTRNLNQLQQLTISPWETYFQLNFALPVYDRPEQNQFIAWLENYDEDWTYLGTNPMVRYTKLPPGKYTLHLRGAPPNGEWSAQALTIPIEVNQVFYRTWWFVLLVLALIAAAIYFFLQSRLEQRLKVEQLRTKLSSDLHDEMSGLLSGIAMQTDVLRMKVADDASKDKLKRIGEVSRHAMSKMNDVIWSIDSRKDKMENLIERMRDHADDILNPMEIKYELHQVKIDPAVKIPFEIRQELYFIFKEAINNVAKHAQATRVRIVLENTGKEFRLKVVDNGRGATISGFEKKGQGLTNLRMRAQRIQANLSIHNKEGFAVELKMKRFA